MGGDNNNVEFQSQVSSQVSLHSIKKKKKKKELEIFSNVLRVPAKQSRISARVLMLGAAALAYTDCFMLEQNV